MKIAPVTLLKPNRIGIIQEMKNDGEKTAKLMQRLNAVGFVPGHEIKVKQNLNGISTVQVGNDNPFALRHDSTDKIIIQAKEEDLYNSYKEMKRDNSFLTDVKKFIKNLLGSKKFNM